MRTKPMFNAEFQMDSDGTRPAPGFGSIAVLMPPGRYTVQLTVDGQSLQQPLLLGVGRRHRHSSCIVAHLNCTNVQIELFFKFFLDGAPPDLNC